MSERHDEPAFPCHTNKMEVCAVTGKEAMIPILNGGMSKRELFAAFASCSEACRLIAQKQTLGDVPSPLALAYAAFDIADAMLVVAQKGRVK